MLLSIILFTGCTVVRIDTTNIDNIISVVLSKKNTLYNRVGKGYKYYVPRGVTYIDTTELNDKLYSNGNYYYLYIDAVGYFYKNNIDYELDAVSYYHKVKVNYKENKDAYYSKKIDVSDKEGYLEIQKQKNDKYVIEFVYNYAKIEAMVDKEDINEVVLNASYILSTVKFNNKVIKLMLNETYFTNKEEKYDIFADKDNNVSNSHVVEYEEDNKGND